VGGLVLTAFDHPSHRAAEELSAEARRLILAEKTAEARKLYARAAREELVVARTLDSRKETDDLAVSYTRKMRSILAISGVACFVKAQRWDEAAEAAREFLALPDLLLPDGTRNLEEFLRQAQQALEVPKGLRRLPRPPDLTRVRILEQHEHPILSELRAGATGDAYLEKWCARIGITEYSLVVRSDLRSIEQYMAKRITMRQLLENGSDLGCMLVDRTIGADGDVNEQFWAAWLEDLPESYLPPLDAFHDESLRPAWERTVQSYLLGDDWTGDLINGIERTYLEVAAFLYCAANDAQYEFPAAVLSYQYRGGRPVVTAFSELRSSVPARERARTVGVVAHSPGILSIDAKTNIAEHILRSIAILDRATVHYDIVQEWAKQDPLKDPVIPPSAEEELRRLANILSIDLGRLMRASGDVHAVGKLLTAYFRRLVRLAHPVGDAEFLGVERSVAPTAVLTENAYDDE